MSVQSVREKFKENLLDFISELVIEFPEEGDIIMMKMVLQEIHEKIIIDNFVKDILPLSNHVKSRNDEFFLKHQILSMGSSIKSEEKRNHFKKLWETNTDKETRDTIWEWFDVLIQIGDVYNEMIKKNDASF